MVLSTQHHTGPKMQMTEHTSMVALMFHYFKVRISAVGIVTLTLHNGPYSDEDKVNISTISYSMKDYNKKQIYRMVAKGSWFRSVCRRYDIKRFKAEEI